MFLFNDYILFFIPNIFTRGNYLNSSEEKLKLTFFDISRTFNSMSIYIIKQNFLIRYIDVTMFYNIRCTSFFKNVIG